MRPLLWKRVFLQFPIYFFAIFNSKGLNCKRDAYVLRFFTSTWAVGGGGEQKKTKQNKTKKTSDFFHSISLDWLNNTLFGTEIAIGLGLALFRNAFR